MTKFLSPFGQAALKVCLPWVSLGLLFGFFFLKKKNKQTSKQQKNILSFIQENPTLDSYIRKNSKTNFAFRY